jgi:mevalonate kinase
MRSAGLPHVAPPATMQSPGKAILFGEHAVVYGHMAVVLALDLPTRVTIVRQREGNPSSCNGSPTAFLENPYLRELSRRFPELCLPSLSLTVRSEIPPASGLGSSAAFVTGVLAALLADRGDVDRADLARSSFLVERGAQGIGSPVDTSVATAGGVLAVGTEAPGEMLWEIPRVEEKGPWKVTGLSDPGWTWVVAYTGVPKDTGRTVSRVGERLRRPDGPALLERIGDLAKEGLRALQARDRVAVGQIMDRNQALLLDLGVDHPRSSELIGAVRGLALGAKITGAGSGGSVLALPPEGRELEVARAFARAGALPFVVRTDPEGVRPVAPSPSSPSPPQSVRS